MKARLPQGMGGGPQNMQSMLRQAQKMQENIEAKKAELEEKEYVVSSGGGNTAGRPRLWIHNSRHQPFVW